MYGDILKIRKQKEFVQQNIYSGGKTGRTVDKRLRQNIIY
jgi:hypothetical protein